MIKDIFTYIIVFTILFLIGFYTHEYVLSSKEIQLSFSLKKIYLFNAFFSLLICVNLRLLSASNKLFNQIGFIYLAFLIIKLFLLISFLYKSVIAVEEVPFVERLTLLIPLFIFLFTEVIFVTKTLNRKG